MTIHFLFLLDPLVSERYVKNVHHDCNFINCFLYFCPIFFFASFISILLLLSIYKLMIVSSWGSMTFIPWLPTLSPLMVTTRLSDYIWTIHFHHPPQLCIRERQKIHKGIVEGWFDFSPIMAPLFQVKWERPQ